MNTQQKNMTRKYLASLRTHVAAGKAIPSEIFEILLDVVPQVAIEIIVSRAPTSAKLTPHTPILLTRRDQREVRYGGWWHLPGSYIRCGERSTDVFERLARRELDGTARLTQPTLVGVLNHHRDPHGSPCVSLLYRCSLTGQPRHGQWFTVRALPSPLVAYHQEILLAASGAILRPGREPRLAPRRLTAAISGELLW